MFNSLKTAKFKAVNFSHFCSFYQKSKSLVKLVLTGVYFIKIESLVYFIEVSLSICALCLNPTFTPKKASQKMGVMLFCCAPSFMKSTPVLFLLKQFFWLCVGLGWGQEEMLESRMLPVHFSVKSSRKLMSRHFWRKTKMKIKN